MRAPRSQAHQPGTHVRTVRARSHLLLNMASPGQAELARLWKHAPRGRMSPWTEALAWGLREGWRSTHKGSAYGMLPWVAGKLVLEGGGQPTEEAVRRLFAKIDGDATWFPGKVTGSEGGRPGVLSAQSKGAIARAAMALKSRGLEPTFSLVVAQCPKATLNPITGKVVDKKRVYDVLREKCFDADADQPWAHRPRLSKTILTEDDMRRRDSAPPSPAR